MRMKVILGIGLVGRGIFCMHSVGVVDGCQCLNKGKAKGMTKESKQRKSLRPESMPWLISNVFNISTPLTP